MVQRYELVNIGYELVKMGYELEKVRVDLGPDNIHPMILHDLREALCIPTTIILNTSLATKTIPDDWKEGCITAIFKKGSRKLIFDEGQCRMLS
jgi:hypothetical protein